ncbi:hypothetical protein B0I35DRAFT_190888 [Stachybotrys elegans]|uniref:Uncharacterized protein n=1 Tax=Stachybotrys elegans TaxID=80388 RepID=A0A8K0SVW3_9HYPO|nr:hypothetical protein B0I35DRAFT_190888 [Stachybotrys elegans]
MLHIRPPGLFFLWVPPRTGSATGHLLAALLWATRLGMPDGLGLPLLAQSHLASSETCCFARGLRSDTANVKTNRHLVIWSVWRTHSTASFFSPDSENFEPAGGPVRHREGEMRPRCIRDHSVVPFLLLLLFVLIYIFDVKRNDSPHTDDRDIIMDTSES